MRLTSVQLVMKGKKILIPTLFWVSFVVVVVPGVKLLTKRYLCRKYCEEDKFEVRENSTGMIDLEDGLKIDDLAAKFQCMSLHKRDTAKRGKTHNLLTFAVAQVCITYTRL